MAQTHVYAHTGAASLVHVDDGLRAQHGEPFGLASQAAIAFRAHQLGFIPTREARTPIDWRPTHAVRVLEAGTDAGTDAWWLALLRSGIATRHTGAGAGSGLPLDPALRHFRPPQDGGGPVVWELVPTELFSADLCAHGLVRLVDMYGGRQDGSGRWMRPSELNSVGRIGPFGDDAGQAVDAWVTRVKPVYTRLRAAVEASPEAARWLDWFSQRQSGDGRPKEHPEVEWRLHPDAYSVVAVEDVKEAGVVGQ